MLSATPVRLVVLTNLLALSIAGCGGSGGKRPAPVTATESPTFDENAVVARVDDYEIKAAAVLARAAAVGNTPDGPSAEEILDRLIDEALLAAEGLRLGLEREPEVVAAEQAARRRVAAELLEQELVKDLTIEETTLRSMYHELADSVELEGIFVSKEEKAREIRKRIEAGADFAEEAKGSLHGSAENGGKLGSSFRAQLPPELAAFAFSAPVGTLSEPIQVRLGWALIRVVERTLGDDAGFEKKREALLRHATQRLGEQARTHYVKKLREEQGIALDEAFIDKTGSSMSPTPEEAEHVVARVGDRELRYAAVLDTMRAQLRIREGGHMSGASVKSSIAWRMIDELLLQETAATRGLAASPEADAAALEARRAAVVTALTRRVAESAPRATEAEVEAFFREHQQAFELPPRRVCAHILVEDEARAKEVRALLDRGESFADLAQRYSVDEGTRGAGGVLPEMTDARLDAMASAGEETLVEAMRKEVGSISAPLQSRYGWHVVRVVEIKPASVPPFAEVRAKAEARLMARRRQQAVEDQIAALQKRATIRIERDVLEQLAAGLEVGSAALP